MLTIERINKGPWGKIMAYFDLRTSDGLVVKGFKLLDGDRGYFIGMPSQKGKDDKYYDQVFCDQDVKEQILELALDAHGGIQEQRQAAPPPTEAPPGDDDIPF